MVQVAEAELAAPDRAMRDAAAVVGIGFTDYPAHYQASRDRTAPDAPYSAVTLAQTALQAALTDAQLDAADVDGVFVSGAGDELAPSCVVEELGLRPKRLWSCGPLMSSAVPAAARAIARGECRTAALVYASSARLRRGSARGAPSSSTPSSYYYHRPWGWASQPAHWAVMINRYTALYGGSEADLGQIAVTLRRNASLSPRAIMTTPLTIDEYLESRHIVRPLRVFDLCLVSDGGFCAILSASDSLASHPSTPVLVSGWGHARATYSKLKTMVMERLRPQFETSAEQAFTMSGRTHQDVDFLQGYDSSSVHLLNQLEGYGFVDTGDALRRWVAGDMALSGKLPVNTSGGMLSEVYLHGWSQFGEAVEQLRHEAGLRQVAGARVGMVSVATTDEAHPLVLSTGDARG